MSAELGEKMVESTPMHKLSWQPSVRVWGSVYGHLG